MEITASSNPYQIFDQWFADAGQAKLIDRTAMTLATSDREGWPTARQVLLKKHDEQGFVFYTNYNSDKAKHLEANPKASLVFHWLQPEHRQIRIRGRVVKTSFEESNEYFQSRDRGSQIGAWASPQSSEISGREELLQKSKELEEKYKDQSIPCPEHWGGFLLQPLVIEFWQERDHRLHDRFQFSRKSLNDSWELKRLAP